MLVGSPYRHRADDEHAPLDLEAVGRKGSYEGQGDPARIADDIGALERWAARHVASKNILLWVGIIGLPSMLVVAGVVALSGRSSDTEWMIAALCWLSAVLLASTCALLYWLSRRRPLEIQRIRFARTLFECLHLDPVRKVETQLRFTPTELVTKESPRPQWSHEDTWFGFKGHLVYDTELELEKTELLAVESNEGAGHLRRWLTEDRFRLTPDPDGARRVSGAGPNLEVTMPSFVSSSDVQWRDRTLFAAASTKARTLTNAPSSASHVHMVRQALEVLENLHRKMRAPATKPPWSLPTHRARAYDAPKKPTRQSTLWSRLWSRLAPMTPVLLTLACIVPLDLAACGGYLLDDASYFSTRQEDMRRRMQDADRCRRTGSKAYSDRPEVLSDAPRAYREYEQRAMRSKLYGSTFIGAGILLELGALFAVFLRWRRRGGRGI